MKNMYTTPDTIRCWSEIDFRKAEKSVKKLQKRIAEAFCNDDVAKMSYLQNKLIHSFYAKALAVKIVTSNKGSYTPGVDNILWIDQKDKFDAIYELDRRGYRPMMLRRIYIPKANGSFRPLSIPTMKDRAMQTLYKFALEPIGQITADRGSFAYLKNRDARCAIAYLNDVLSDNPNFVWIMKADIKACFDNISHEWIMEHIPMDKEILWKFLKCGYVENSISYPVERGVPQGGCISSVICNMVLDGLERLLEEHFEDSVCMIRYADDIVIVGESRKKLVQGVTPVVENFLLERGLFLSKEKTGYFSVYQGIHFLGWNVRKIGKNIISEPTEESKRSLLKKILDLYFDEQIYLYKDLFKKVSQRVRGWLNYYDCITPLHIINSVEYDIIISIKSITGDAYLAGFIGEIFTQNENKHYAPMVLLK